MDEAAQPIDPQTFNYSLPGISSKRIFRRAAIRLNLSKVSGRWNETQKTDWPYPSTYVRHQRPQKYIRSDTSMSWADGMQYDDPEEESDPLIREYLKGLFAAGMPSKRSWERLSETYITEDGHSYSTEEEKTTNSKEKHSQDSEAPLEATSLPDSWKMVTKIEEVASEDEDDEVLVRQKERTRRCGRMGSKIEISISDPVKNTQPQDLHIKNFLEDEVLIPHITQENGNRSASWTPNIFPPTVFPIAAIQVAPEYDIFLRNYSPTLIEDEVQWQKGVDETSTCYLQVQNHSPGLYPSFQNHPNFEAIESQEKLTQELNIQTLQSRNRIRLPGRYNTNTHGMEDLEYESIHSNNHLLPHAILQREQLFMDEIEKIHFHRLGLEEIILHQLSLEEAVVFSQYERRLLHPRDINNLAWEEPHAEVGLPTLMITPLQESELGTLEQFERVNLALGEYDFA